MSTTISVLGGVGLFLLGMSIMATGLNAVAGSGLRATLSKAAATPSAEDAMAWVDSLRRLDALAHHAWRAAVHLVGVGA